MLNVIKRLVLGISLIVIASGALLFFDWSHRHSGKSNVPHIAVFQFASNSLLDEGVAGVLDGLKEHGYVEGRTIKIDRFNAENDLPTANSIARTIVEGQYDLAITVSTPCLQALASVNRDGKVVHVFGLVTDPFSAGVGLNRAHPEDHPRHLVGNGTFQPVRDALLYARQCYPALRRVGTVWNGGEASSEACIRVARSTCKELGIEFMEAQVENSTSVGEAASSLVARGVEALFVGGDNTVEMSIQSVVRAAEQGRIPVIACAPGDVNAGVLMGLGADYLEVGRIEGRLAAEVLSGRDPRTIPIGTVMPKKLGLNLSVLPRMAAPWQIPAGLRKDAAITIDENGKRHDKAFPKDPNSPTATNPSSPPTGASTKKWRIHLVELVNAPAIDDTRDGILAGFKEAGLVAGRDYDLKEENAQGDMATLTTMIDAGLSTQADMIYTITTPALQAALQKVHDRPLMFALALDPLLVGDKGTHEKHFANVAGVYDRSPFEEMIKVLRECLPNARTIGTLYAPSESNSVNFRDELDRAARAAGLKLVALPSTSSNEVPDAAAALTERGIDAICQISDNLHGAAFPSIVAAAHRARLPLFSFSVGQAAQGSAVVVSNDHFDGGRESALIAVRVMRGESPASFPYRGITKTRLLINRAAAAAAGMQIPESVARRAETR